VRAPSAAAAVADRLHSAAIHLLRRLRREDAALGVSAARLSALSVVVFGGPLTLGELAAAEGVRPPTMTRIVAALKAEGLVSRQKDAGDRRVRRIQATERGEALIRYGQGRRTARLAGVLAALDPADLATVARATAILEGVVEGLNAPRT
jgi:DNA-binding MarR family transcriptional regulator